MKTQSQQANRKLLSLSTVALATTIALAASMGVQAADKPSGASPTQAKPDPNQGVADAMLRYSQAGRDAIANINTARDHLIDGQTDLARTELKQAQTALLTAKAEAPTFVDQTKVIVQGKQVGEESSNIKSDLVPVSSDVVLAENFTVQEKHKPFLARAKDMLTKGDRKGALETLKAGDVDVAFNRVWMPLASTEKLLDQAISQTAKKDYYAANLSLKAIQDNLRVDSVNYDTPPTAPRS